MIPKSFFKHARCGYLHADGSVLILYTERHAKMRNVETSYARLFAPELVGLQPPAMSGRVVFHDIALLALICTSCTAVRLHVGSISEGSDKTKALNLAVAGLTLYTAFGTTHFSALPDLLSAAWTYQPDHTDSYASMSTKSMWSDHPLAVVQSPRKAA